MRHSMVWICLTSLAAAASPLLVSCGDPETNAVSPSGTLALSLRATGLSGAQYRLRNGTFIITGPVSTVASTEDHPDAESIDVELEVGSYSVMLNTGWFIERDGGGGTFESVEATLLSPNPQDFAIVDRRTTQVRFRFRVAGEVIEISGSLSIGIEVGCSRAAFTPLDRTGAPFTPNAVSSDGCVVVGDLDTGAPDYTHAARWTEGEGMVDLSTPETVLSRGLLTNHDGSLLVVSGGSKTFVRAPEGELRPLSGCSGASTFSIQAMSDAGDVLAGSCGNWAARWVDFGLSGTTLEPWGDIPLEVALDVSADGQAFACLGEGRDVALLWSAPGGTAPVVAYDSPDLLITADGRCVFAGSGHTTEIVRWCDDEVTNIPVPDGPFGNYFPRYVVNGAGSMAIMNYDSGAWLWREGQPGLTPLLDALADAGVNLFGWTGLTVHDMTPDGRVLVGVAYSTDGAPRTAFRIVVPQW